MYENNDIEENKCERDRLLYLSEFQDLQKTPAKINKVQLHVYIKASVCSEMDLINFFKPHQLSWSLKKKFDQQKNNFIGDSWEDLEH